ncbi:MAG: glycosyltransferase family 9 protein [Acidobacteriota bacterium]|nr:MAG: glycosyltransferase family 9 protein [Acidobacteriota bacterium]
MASELDRILVAQLAYIGDMVFTTPLFDAIKQRWPRSRLAVAGLPEALEVLEDHPAVDLRVPYDKRGEDRGAGGFGRAARAVRSFGPELFIGVTRSARTAMLALLSGARYRVGFGEPGRRWAYTHAVGRRDEQPFAARSLGLLEPLGGRPGLRPLHLFVGRRRREMARAALAGAGWRDEPLLAIAPGSRYVTKRWPERHVGRLLDIALEAGRLRPALYGGPDERALIERLLTGRPAVLDRRSTRVGEMVAELSLAAVVLGGDSGPTHIGRALGVPTVLVLGPTPAGPLEDGRPFARVQRGLDCQPCSVHGDESCPLGHHACLEELPAEEVYRAVVEAHAWLG